MQSKGGLFGNRFQCTGEAIFQNCAFLGINLAQSHVLITKASTADIPVTVGLFSCAGNTGNIRWHTQVHICFSFLFFFSYSESGISGQTAGIRTSIYYTRPTIQRDVTASGIAPRTCDTSTKSRPPLTPLQPSNVDSTSAISQPGSCIKKKVAWADQGKLSLFNYTNYTKLQQLHQLH